MYGSNQWDRGHHFYRHHGWGHHHHHRPFFLPALLIFGFLLWSGVFWWILKLVFIVALIGVVGKLISHNSDWSWADKFTGYCDDTDSDGSKRKNGDKAKRGVDPFDHDLEII